MKKRSLLTSTSVSSKRNILPTKVLVAAALLMSTGLVACGRGGNEPKGTSAGSIEMLKKRCALPNALSAETINKLKVIQRQELQLAKTSALPLEIRTYLYSDKTTDQDRSLGDAASIQRLAVANKDGAPDNANDISLEVDCNSLKATYMGPGVNSPIEGQLKEVKSQSLVILAKDAVGNKVDVKIELLNSKESSSKPSRTSSTEKLTNLNRGSLPVQISVTRHLKISRSSNAGNENVALSKSEDKSQTAAGDSSRSTTVVRPQVMSETRTQVFRQDIAPIGGTVEVEESALTDTFFLLRSTSVEDKAKLTALTLTVKARETAPNNRGPVKVVVPFKSLQEIQVLALKNVKTVQPERNAVQVRYDVPTTEVPPTSESAAAPAVSTTTQEAAPAPATAPAAAPAPAVTTPEPAAAAAASATTTASTLATPAAAPATKTAAVPVIQIPPEAQSTPRPIVPLIVIPEEVKNAKVEGSANTTGAAAAPIMDTSGPGRMIRTGY